MDIVAGLDAAQSAERALEHALRPESSLKEEKALQRAEAVRAAAMGLNDAGCASAAGIPERMIKSWRAEDPVFDTAVSAARALAVEHNVTPDVATNPAALRVALNAILSGTPFVSVGYLVGVKRDSFYRLRRNNPKLDALFGAALNYRRRNMSASYRRKTKLKGYRLVRLESESSPDGPLG
ncbi:hypothetical protein [Streptomyces anulatus]|uniref:hypothetical protein n=1 Tax=Streptomyces anulatus TaxID=1892 RepID=UPI0035E25C7C